MHNKFAVIDNKTVITGSFNWSAGYVYIVLNAVWATHANRYTYYSARYKNRENIIVTNIPSVVGAYAHEFKELWNHF